jgi:hypothetical protein
MVNLNLLGEELKRSVKGVKKQSKADIDAVLCQPIIPEDTAARIVYDDEERTEIVITSKIEGIYNQAVYNVFKTEQGQYIDSIRCTEGEVAPDREFTFENEGFLAKNVPAPYTSGRWHIAYVENKELILAPINTNDSSVCIQSNGDEGACNLTDDLEAKQVKVYGDLSETGVEVKKIEFLN